MKGNKYSKGGDPMKSRAKRRRDKKQKMAQSPRAVRLRTKLKVIRERKDKKQGNVHTTALMESFVLRRKAERRAEMRTARDEAAKAAKTAKAEGAKDDAPAAGKKGEKKAARPAAASSRALY
jgi:hypothetical protein